MFKSKEANDSQFLNNLTLSRLNETCNGKPQLTSTPLNSPSSRRKPVLPPAIAKHATPRRYSLSEVSSPSRKIIPKPTTSNSPGPLLASLTLKDNVSMYQETKSSGLARRIVQYNEETDKKNKKHYTHQEQYGSPGLFPVVHLFRKKLPSMERTPERIRPKLSSPEYLKSLSPMINKNLDRSHLLDDLMRSRYPRQSSLPAYSQNGVETKSVLEALKEISRKRIHSSEEYEAMDTGKRAKTDPRNGTATNKRTRVDSPPLNSSGSPSSKQSQKKFCNEFDASKSSSNLPMLNKTGSPKSLKRKTTSTSTESLENGRQVKVVAVETQTPITLPKLKEKSPEIVEEVIVKELPEKPKPMVRIFDNAFVDNYRGKRLSALMGTAFDKDISVDVSEPESVIVEEPTEVQTPITSILSSPKSNKQNTEKHVHFNEITTATAPLLDQPSLTQTSSASTTVTPIIVSKSAVVQQNVLSDSITTPVVSTAPTFSFGNATCADKTDASKPSETSPQKLGGFKFDLKAPVSTAAKTTSPSISFPIIATSANTVTFSKPSESSVIVFGSSSTTTTAALKTTEPSLAFGNALAKSPAISFGANTTVSSENKAPSFSFTNTPSTAPSFGITSTTTTSAAPAISFGTSTAAPALVTPSINFTGQSTAQPAFNFASNKPTTAPPSMFGSNTTTATVTPTFGSPQVSKSSTVFGSGTTTTSAPTFGNTASVFGTAPVTSAPAFGSGTAASSAFGAPASVFGTPATTASVFGATSPAAPAFGSTASVFGSAPATCAPMMFGSAKATTSAPMFGSATTTTSAPPTFGSTASSFGSTPAPVFSGFGAKPTPAFGSTQATPAPVFGANSAPTFANKSNVFGATTQAPPPAYGSPSANSTFGQPQSLFGAAAFGGTTTTTSATSFGTTSTFSFGANKPATTNPFGTTTTTSNSTFGTANAFSATTKSGSTFGANTFSGGGFSASAPSSTFGSTNAPVFGQTDNKASFAFGGGETKTNSNVFGTAASAFSKPSGFGGAAAAATSGFGTANSARPQVNGGFNFGSNTAAAPFAFGGASGTGASEPAKPSFSFGGSTNPAPAFGNPSAAPAFGTPPPSFAAPAFSATGTPGAGAGIFNIGAGSTGGRPRTQLRAKRRT